MPSSRVRRFSDPAQYATGVRAANVQMTIVGERGYTATLTRVDLHRLWMQRFNESGSRVAYIAHEPGRAIFEFFTGTAAEVVQLGRPVPLGGLVRSGRSDDYFQRTSGVFSWGTMSVPTEDVAALEETMMRRDLTPGFEPQIIVPPAAMLARLRRLHGTVGRMAEGAPELIENPEVARGLEQSLLAALLDCLTHGGERNGERFPPREAKVMRRFHELLEENLDRALYLPELCAHLRVSERTLRAFCHEHLGLSPQQYLRRRRLYLAHRALRRALPGTTTVTDVATSFGFWHFGRFSAAYRVMFGEPPSATLSCPPA